MNRGKLIVFEGIDGSGKGTQVESLISTLRNNKIMIAHFSFPDYLTSTGKLIKMILNKQIEYSMEAFQLLYAANRLEKKNIIENFLEEGINVLCDRYTYSALAFGLAQKQDKQFLIDIDREMPKPDIVLLFDLPVQIAAERMRNKNKDMNEENVKFQNEVRNNYLDILEMYRGTSIQWFLVDAARTEQEVKEQVHNIILPNF